MIRPTSKEQIPAAAYVRMSSDDQVNSPERQRQDLTRLADREKCNVVEWYSDEGITGTQSVARPDFQRMMADAASRRFKAILLTEQSRFSREDVLDVLVHIRDLKNAGVVLVTEQRGRIDPSDFASVLSFMCDANVAREESLKISRRSVSGKRARATAGKHVNGNRVFAYDREIRDEDGEVIKIVNFRQMYRKSPNHRFKLVPSLDGDAVQAVRDMFTLFREGCTGAEIAVEMNSRGITTTFGSSFESGSVLRILSNPIYIGTLRAGVRPSGQFNRIADVDGPIVVENVHDALVDSRLFHEVQELIKSRKKFVSKSLNGRYLLSKMIMCECCGAALYGHFTSKHNKRSYDCKRRNRSNSTTQKHTQIEANSIENAILEKIREQLDTPNAKRELKAAVARYSDNSEPSVRIEENRLENVKWRIEKMEDNLAEADTSEDFNAIKKRLKKLRDQRDELAQRIETSQAIVTTLTPAATAAMARISEAVSALDSADRVPLRLAIMQVVERIDVTRKCRKGEISITSTRGRKSPKPVRVVEWHVRVEWKEGIFEEKHAEFKISVGDGRWRQLVEFVRNAQRRVKTKEVADHFGLQTTSAMRMLKRGRLVGLVEWAGTQRGGWISTDLKDNLRALPIEILDVVTYVRDERRPVTRSDVASRFDIGNTTAMERLKTAEFAGALTRESLNGQAYAWVPADCDQSKIGPRKEIQAYIDFLLSHKRPVSARETAAHFSVDKITAIRWLKEAESIGAVNRIGSRQKGGWVATLRSYRQGGSIEQTARRA